MKHGARFIAIEVLCKWEESGQAADLVMEQCLKRFPVADPRDSHLALSLVYGVIRWRTFLDRIVAGYSTHPLRKMKTRTLQALRVGLFQLVFMDRIPVSAAINESVKAMKAARQPKWLVNFVNGLLRSIDRNRENLADPWDLSNSSVPIHDRLNHPEWIFERWRTRFGRGKAVEICCRNNTQAPLSLRVNTKAITRNQLIEKFSQAGISARPGMFAPESVCIEDVKGPVSEIPGYKEGFFAVQDEAAQLAVLLMGRLQRGKRYLDGCAGLGGKTCQLAGMLPEKSSLDAVEPSKQRIRLLKENLGRLGFSEYVTIYNSRLEELNREERGLYDGILLDAPCSGLGVIRRHPDIRWNRSLFDLRRFHDIQIFLADRAADMLSPGGCLVFATCSMEPEENEEVIRDFLAAYPDFSLSDCNEFLPLSCRRFVDKNGFFRTISGEYGLDGFFGARLIRCSL